MESDGTLTFCLKGRWLPCSYPLKKPVAPALKQLPHNEVLKRNLTADLKAVFHLPFGCPGVHLYNTTAR